jgi:hypothetical protein
MSELLEPKVIDCDPDKLFLEIFTNYPKDPCTYQIVSQDIKLEERFEILLDLYGEALMNKNILLYFLNKIDDPYQDLKIDYHNITETDLLIPELWFKSFGYCILITELHEDMIHEINPYCSIMFKDNPLDSGFFYMKKISNNYHFVKKQNYKNKDNLKKIKAILTLPTKKFNTKTYSISFTDFHKIINNSILE